MMTNAIYSRLDLFSKNKSNLILYIFLLFVFAFPRTMQEVKYVLLITLFLSTASNFYYLKKIDFKNILIYACILLFPLTIALLNNNNFDFIVNRSRIFFLDPLLLFLIFSLFSNNDLIKILSFAAFSSLLVSFLINLSTLLFHLNLFPINLNTFFYIEEDKIGFHEGFLHITNSSFSYWIYTIPLLFANFNKKSFYVILLISVLFILSFLSGRRILMLPFIIVFLFEFKNLPRLIFLFAIILVLSNFEIVNSLFELDTVLNRFDEAIKFSGDSQIREEQRSYFYKYISENPLRGYGIGSYMPDYLRNEKFLYAYENSFDYLFFERGIIFGILTFVFYIYLILNCYNNIFDKKYRIGFALASVSILLASYTNPYWLSSFDYTIPLSFLLRFSNKPIV